MTILDCTPSDAAEIAELERKYSSVGYTEEMVRGMFNERAVVLKAVEGDTVAGYAAAEVVIDSAEVQNVVVAENMRRSGVGTALMKALMAECRQRGAEKIFLEVDENNVAAKSLYKKLGFVKISERKKYYGDNTAEIYAAEI